MYEWVASRQTVELFLQLNASDRALLLQVFDELAGNPFAQGDAVAVDDSGRELQVLIRGHLVITFWSDHPEKEVRVLALTQV